MSLVSSISFKLGSLQKNEVDIFSRFLRVKMDFFHQSDDSQTDSDISEEEDEHLSGALSEREEDILLRDGLLQHHLPQKNDWTFQSFSKRGSDYIGNLKLKIDPILDSCYD